MQRPSATWPATAAARNICGVRHVWHTHSEAPGLVVSPSMVHRQALGPILMSVVGPGSWVWTHWYSVAEAALSFVLFSTTSCGFGSEVRYVSAMYIEFSFIIPL